MPQITPAHLHILVNHIPIIGFPIIALLMFWGLARKQDAVIRAALLGAFLIGAGTWFADYTGDGAKDDIRHLAWYNKAAVQEHEEAADWANIAGIATGVLALGALILARGGRQLKRGAVYGVMALLVLDSAIVAKTGYEGGKIRHDEFGATEKAP